jgi:23S rRNA pseudouridine1911/1915/1917 synthase
MRTKILYEDNHILIVHKPAGLATQTSHVGQQDVVSELKNYLKSPYLGVVHRLDQPVEGLLVFAKTKEAAGKLTKQLSGGTLNKQYYALVCGKPEESRGELVDYLVKEGNVGRVGEATEKEAKQAILQYKVIKSMTPDCSLVDVHIETGRFHQIRLQMANAGHPILGDLKYGSKESIEMSWKYQVKNVALYAYRIQLYHPMTGKKLDYAIEPVFPVGEE